MSRRRASNLIAWGLIPTVLAACVATGDPVAVPTVAVSSTGVIAGRATPLPSDTPSAAPTRVLVPTPTYPPVDYAPMIDEIKQYVKTAGIGPRFDLAVGFVDLQTGQTASFDGDTRHISLSTFKGPLGAYYLWLVERGEIAPQPGDETELYAMLNESDNAATACIFKHVGGLAGFNDWLAQMGLSRENNFVSRWQNYGCAENGKTTFLAADTRYGKGDQSLNLPGNSALQNCAPKRQPCAEAFAPLELAMLYARIYRGEVLSAGDTAHWLRLMAKKRENIALVKSLPSFAPARAFVKNGFSAKNADDPLNYYHEAGVVETPFGVYALAVFTQGNPEWPGAEPLGAVGKIVYDFFTDAYRGR